MRISASVPSGRGAASRGARTRSGAGRAWTSVDVGLANDVANRNSIGLRSRRRSSEEPGIGRSRQGQASSVAARVSAVVGRAASWWSPQPPHACAVVSTSILTHPSGSRQITKPFAGVSPVERATARQNHAVRRWRSEAIEKCSVGKSALKRQPLEPIARLRRECWRRSYSPCVPRTARGINSSVAASIRTPATGFRRIR